MASDNLVADEHNNTDLLWALRGAGNGNFGVVTSLTYAIHPLTQATNITARWPGLDDLPAVFDAWQSRAPYTDNRLTSQLEIRRGEVMLGRRAHRRVRGRGDADAGPDPVGRHTRRRDEGRELGRHLRPGSRSRPTTNQRTGSSSRSSSPSRSRPRRSTSWVRSCRRRRLQPRRWVSTTSSTSWCRGR